MHSNFEWIICNTALQYILILLCMPKGIIIIICSCIWNKFNLIKWKLGQQKSFFFLYFISSRVGLERKKIKKNTIICLNRITWICAKYKLCNFLTYVSQAVKTRLKSLFHSVGGKFQNLVWLNNFLAFKRFVKLPPKRFWNCWVFLYRRSTFT